jgi:DNA-binding response OmpR family regulator
MRILLLSLDDGSTEQVKQSLAGQGYEITTGRSLTVDEILGLSPEVLITEATPSDLSCCGVVSQIKAGPVPRTLKIVMIVHGAALERARALDLGADDVISFPFDCLEFAARVRNQFRERQPEVELQARLDDALQKEHLAETAVHALSSSVNAKRRYWLMPASLILGAAMFLAVVGTIVSNRHRRKDTLQLQAEVERLNGGIVQQGELLRRVEQARASLAASDASKTRASLATKLSNQFWSGFTPDARQPFGGYFVLRLVSRIAGVVLAVKMCEESEVSELSPLERSGVAQKRLRFVSFESL